MNVKLSLTHRLTILELRASTSSFLVVFNKTFLFCLFRLFLVVVGIGGVVGEDGVGSERTRTGAAPSPRS